MKNTELCPKCQVGADAYKLDPKEPMCPYLHCHNGEKMHNVQRNDRRR